MAAASSSAGAAANAALGDVAGHHHQQVGAQAADLLDDLLPCAAADGNHGDHGGDADDDAEHGEGAAQLVQTQRVEGGDECVEEAHSAASARSSPRS
jgi:hypothetical protein